MLTLFLRILKDRRISLSVYSLFGVLTVWMYAAVYQSIQDQAERFSELISAYPEGFIKALGLEKFDFSTFEKFIAVEQFNLTWGIMVTFMLASFAAQSIAGEVDRGTADILLARPVSRWRIFFGRYLAGVFTLSAFSFFSIFSVFPIAKIYSLSYTPESYFKFATLGFLFGIAILGLSMLLSSIFSDKGKVYVVTGGMLGIMYMLEIASNLKENLSDLQYFSFFHYFSTEPFLTNRLSLTSVVVFMAIAFISAAAGAIQFFKRDIKIS